MFVVSDFVLVSQLCAARSRKENAQQRELIATIDCDPVSRKLEGVLRYEVSIERGAPHMLCIDEIRPGFFSGEKRRSNVFELNKINTDQNDNFFLITTTMAEIMSEESENSAISVPIALKGKFEKAFEKARDKLAGNDGNLMSKPTRFGQQPSP